jgi:predicted metal-dependent enzyme (double-stranded beta helix superfamily)
MFDPETFVTACQAAANAEHPVSAVQEVVAAAIRDGSAIDAVLGTEIKREHDTFLSSQDLTVQRILWPGGSWSPPHDHRMWAVIGVYEGEELNRLYERACEGLQESRICAVSKKEVLALEADAIHSVENPHRELTAGLHVYGGDIVGIDRSAWTPHGREVPFSENYSRQMAMFQVLRDLATERGESLDADARYDALRALRAACDREQRYLTPDEARPVAEQALSGPH